MRDDSQTWAAPAPLTAPLDLGGATLGRVTGLRQTLISGTRVLSTSATGWPAPVQGAPYRIVLRRDRVVEVGGAAHPEGWDEAAGEARSDISDGWTLLELSGAGAFGLLRRGTELSLAEPSASVVRKLWGLDVWLYRFEAEDKFRLHIARALDEALIGHLRLAADLARD
ncbi:MAG: hypothetical protein OIF48_01020 [Silicimonas sp.]|nr:hypothetical protein [Silicimonas sp.]